MDLRKNILRELDRCNWTQTELARRAGYHKTQVGLWLKGARLNEEHLERLAAAFEIEVTQLVLGISKSENESIAVLLSSVRRGLETNEVKELLNLMQMHAIKLGVLSRLEDLKAIHNKKIEAFKKKSGSGI